MKSGRKHLKLRYIIFGVFAAIVLTVLIFMHFGGFGTGNYVDTAMFAKYAQSVENIHIPQNAKIIALGEAAHGNIEFQRLKLDVFRKLVADAGVRAFALEGDYGGCEQVNRYIHGGEGTAQEAAAAIGFAIYRTDEMAELIAYMRDYNENAAEGEDLRFYGFDMQRCAYSFRFLNEACEKLDVDSFILQKLWDGENWNSAYDASVRMKMIAQVKNELKDKKDAAQAIHLADMLLQYCDLQMQTDADGGSMVRDRYMAENVEWILQQEQQRDGERIFIAGHNSHVAKWGSYDSMGKLLSENTVNGYYAIGTDFYKTCCNMPGRSSEKRTNQIFYSRDPLAKTAKMAGFDICWVDFASIPEDSELAGLISEYMYMGNLGEYYSWLMRLLPPSYRMFQPPAVLYDSMILVAEANPTRIIMEKE